MACKTFWVELDPTREPYTLSVPFTCQDLEGYLDDRIGYLTNKNQILEGMVKLLEEEVSALKDLVRNEDKMIQTLMESGVKN